MTSLMTSQGPDQKSVKKNYFTQVYLGTIVLKYQLNRTKIAEEEAF